MSEPQATLEHLVTTQPAAAKVFLRYGLDFCCHGRRPLDEACAEAGVDPAVVRAELAQMEAGPEAEVDWRVRPLDALIDHILDRYHAALRRDVPALIALARRVEQVHADKPSCPRGLVEHLESIGAAVESHLAKEEQILFPLIRAGRGATAHMPMKVMMLEHEDHGENLRRTRALTNDLVAPPEACASWRELYRGLARLEADLMRHIHLENYVLFPRAAEEASHE
ncbi:MAG: iron-sulfur cluster repair protein YtfE [Proteobacteria bacterium]|jgi:regulator of cell morphogenesis and NO signaling|nr:iron-sulfur cluster repair protein YtfE [Pseudomonadota bacterium]